MSSRGAAREAARKLGVALVVEAHKLRGLYPYRDEKSMFQRKFDHLLFKFHTSRGVTSNGKNVVEGPTHIGERELVPTTVIPIGLEQRLESRQVCHAIKILS